MKELYSRRDFLNFGGIGLGALTLAACDRIPGNISLNKGTPTVAAADYRALVCVFLNGGNDAYNLLVPTTQAKYDLYAKSRLDLAIARDQLLPLAGNAADGAAYGLHPSMPELHTLYGQGRAALLSNVGSLTAPATKADFQAGRVPPRLFSHNDQQDQWQTAHPDVSDSSGWAGRIADVLTGANGDARMPMNITLTGTNLLQTGHERFAFGMTAGGPSQLDALEPDGQYSSLRAAFDRVRALDSAHPFERRFAGTLTNGIELGAMLIEAFKNAPALTTTFPDNNGLARQLQMVAKLISVRQALGMKRQIFFVSLGGFDTHDGQDTAQPALFQQLSQALSAFHDATAELGVADAVTSFTASDFGRSLTVNGKGTDHGWSSHHLIVGGAVKGGRIYGAPPSLIADGDDDTEGGRYIPTTSVDQYASTLASWLGVGGSDMGYVLPNIGRFGAGPGFL